MPQAFPSHSPWPHAICSLALFGIPAWGWRQVIFPNHWCQSGDGFSKPLLPLFTFGDWGLEHIRDSMFWTHGDITIPWHQLPVGCICFSKHFLFACKCFSKLLSFIIAHFDLFQAFHESLVLQPGEFASYCCQTAGIPLELPAMGKHAVHSLHLQIAPHLSTVFTCIQLRHFHQEGQQCLPQWLWVDHATGFQLYQVWPQWLQVQQWLSIWGRAWGNVLIAAQNFHHCPMLFRALIQKPHIYPGFCWVSGTTMFPRHGLCQDLGLGVFPKTRAWTFPSQSLFQNCSLLRLYIRFLELISQTAAQSWHAW